MKRCGTDALAVVESANCQVGDTILQWYAYPMLRSLHDLTLHFGSFHCSPERIFKVWSHVLRLGMVPVETAM